MRKSSCPRSQGAADAQGGKALAQPGRHQKSRQRGGEQVQHAHFVCAGQPGPDERGQRRAKQGAVHGKTARVDIEQVPQRQNGLKGGIQQAVHRPRQRKAHRQREKGCEGGGPAEPFVP